MGRKYVDLSGKKFGKLKAIKINPERTIHRAVQWDCVCECGEKLVVSGEYLRQGRSISCGCYRRKKGETEYR